MNKYLSKVEEEILQYYKDVNVSTLRKNNIVDDGISENQVSLNKKFKIIDSDRNSLAVNSFDKRVKITDSVKSVKMVSEMKHEKINDNYGVRFFTR